MQHTVNGIQQIGIGVTDASQAWAWYRKYFGMDVPIFKDEATATLMTRYTSGKAQPRFAILAMNMQGGGGFEIWQYTKKQPVPPGHALQVGDLGVFAVKIKTRDIQRAHRQLGACAVSAPQRCPDGRQHFFARDPFGNWFEIKESGNWFSKGRAATGGVLGCVIGVSDIEKSKLFYQTVAGYNDVVYEGDEAADWRSLPGGGATFRRTILRSSPAGRGAFSKLLGQTELELVQVTNAAPKKIFGGRDWGDLGFIHLCFDVKGMAALGNQCNALNAPFTVDSRDAFDMGKAAGHFSYCEDPDGTLIEFVETHKVPLLAKWGIYLNLASRKREQPLPDWMIKMLALNRVRD
jgi:catechol 2,3-dioxygenase-like lactoylglutathione lyase family enzyme